MCYIAAVASLKASHQHEKGNGMKREMGLLLVLIAVITFLSAGCISSHRTVVVRERPVAVTPGEVVVTAEPPPPQHEVIGVAPTPRHVWTEGYWSYHEGKWMWMPGRWEVRPRRGAIWVAGHWDRTPRGWVWRRGHWG